MRHVTLKQIWGTVLIFTGVSLVGFVFGSWGFDTVANGIYWPPMIALMLTLQSKKSGGFRCDSTLPDTRTQ